MLKYVPTTEVPEALHVKKSAVLMRDVLMELLHLSMKTVVLMIVLSTQALLAEISAQNQVVNLQVVRNAVL